MGKSLCCISWWNSGYHWIRAASYWNEVLWWKPKLMKEFVGYIELKCQDTSTIAGAIQSFWEDNNFSADNFVGFGFDGCSTMAGKGGGVQAILKKMSLFPHCSSLRRNLVVNDTSKLPEIRNTIATVKDTKYKSTNISESITDIVRALERKRRKLCNKKICLPIALCSY